MNFKSVRGKIAGIAGVCLIVSSLILVGYNIYSGRKTQTFINERVSTLIESRSLDGLKNLSGYYAGKIQAEFYVALDAARNMADVFITAKSDPDGGLTLGRDEINAILLRVLKNNPNFNGTYSCWEPDALDGQDAQFQTGQNGNNAVHGRFTPYWNRDQHGNIAVQPLVEYDTMDRHPNGILKGGWYIGPKENHKESVLDPFPYIVQGKKVWLTTLSVPILVKGQFYGVAGTDYNLDFVQKLSETVDKELFGGQGEIIIVSYQGLVVANSEQSDMIGKHFKTLFPNDWQAYLSNIQAGRNEAEINEKEQVFNVIAPIELGRTGKPWAVLVRVPEKAVLADAIVLDNELASASRLSIITQIIVGLVTSIAAIFLLWYAAGGIVRPIRNTVDMLKDIAEGEGDLTKRLDIKTKDEIGEMATWFNLFMGKLQELIRRIVADADSLGTSSAALSSIANQMTTGAKSMADKSTTVATGTEEVNANMTSVAAACEEAATNVNMIVTATEEMTDSINGIAQKSEQSSEVSQSAVSRGAEVSEKLEKLGQGAQEISKITEVISDISAQINLLALNATIEAARAGDAGKGFNVVATEIKELARQTAEATQTVKTQIANIQGATGATVSEVGQILEVIKEVGDIVSSITGEVESQAKVTRDISDNISQTSQGIQEVNENVSKGSVLIGSISTDIKEVNHSVQDVSDSIGQVHGNSEELATLASQLQELVGQFKV